MFSSTVTDFLVIRLNSISSPPAPLYRRSLALHESAARQLCGRFGAQDFKDAPNFAGEHDPRAVVREDYHVGLGGGKESCHPLLLVVRYLCALRDFLLQQ
jgi:hypothetical protein